MKYSTEMKLKITIFSEKLKGKNIYPILGEDTTEFSI